MKDYARRLQTLNIMFGEKYLEELFKHIKRSYDAIERLEGGQLDNFLIFMNAEMERTHRFDSRETLANDKLGYDCIRILAVLNHPCEECAQDPNAWHTRSAFCPHKDNKVIK